MGAASPFTVLFDDVEVAEVLGSTPMSPIEPMSLPTELAAIYGSGLTLATLGDRAYVAINFVAARDGRVSFAEPGHVGGGDVSGFNPNDTWLMGLLRARADAVMVGDGTLRLEPSHIWDHDFIAPDPESAAAFGGWRSARGRSDPPTLVVVSATGEFDSNSAVVGAHHIRLIIATPTGAPAVEAANRLGGRPNARVLATGTGLVDLPDLLGRLKTEESIDFVLCEGGPGLYGTLLAQRSVDEEFLTMSPLIIGAGTDVRRPSLVEGAGFLPGTAPTAAPVSLRRAGDHLFLRSRYRYPLTTL